VATLCPRDGSPLTKAPDVLGPGASGQACVKCTGVLVDWKSAQAFFKQRGLGLRDLHALVARAADVPRPTAPAACTACGKGTMKPLTVDGVELDLCEECGTTWFDRGELSRLSKGKLGATLQAAPVEGETSQTVGVFEMWWDCEYCGTTALLGKSNRFCPGCGAQQNAERRYFPPEGKETAFNGEYEGVDKRCPACATPNGAKANNCRNCGSPLEGGQQVATVADRSSAAPRAAQAAQAAPAAAGRRLWPWVLGVLGMLFSGFCGAAMFWTKDVSVTVASHAWTREIDVERMQAVRDDAWCDSLPSGAYSISRSREQRSTKRIADGEECSTRDVDRGDGTFERKRECHTKYREEPVYADRCHFSIDRWARQRTETATGRGTTPAPQWPATRLERGGCSALGCEREGSRREEYTLELKGADGKRYSCKVPDGKWLQVRDGLERPIKVGVITGSPECDQL
jgi:hypothetical protein